MKKLSLLFVITAFLLTGCVKNQTAEKQDLPTSNDTVVEKSQNVEIQLSDERIKELQNINDRLAVSLMRGDASLAPTFEEFTLTVTDINKTLQATIKNIESELTGKDVPDDLNLKVIGIKAVYNQLRTALLRDKPENTPTPEEFYRSVQDAQTNLLKIVEALPLANVDSDSPEKSSTVTVAVPENLDLYRQKMTEYTQVGGPNPLPNIKFITKNILVPYTIEPERTAVDVSLVGIPLGGGPDKAFASYLKIKDSTAYTLLNIDIDGWAGVSVAIAIAHPIVEKTLLQFPNIKKVVFDYAPGDKPAAISDTEQYCQFFGEHCPELETRCAFCGVTQVSNYASCHSKEFCANIPMQ